MNQNNAPTPNPTTDAPTQGPTNAPTTNAPTTTAPTTMQPTTDYPTEMIPEFPSNIPKWTLRGDEVVSSSNATWSVALDDDAPFKRVAVRTLEETHVYQLHLQGG